MRNFNWETIPKHSVIGKHNIWTADKPDGEYELDTDHMEELFSHKQGQQQLKALKRQSLRGMPTAASGGEMVSILSSKQSMNIGIFLKQFKRPVRDMIEDIKSGSSLSFGSGKLRELCKLLPDDGEGGYAGSAIGFRMASLLKIYKCDIEAEFERQSKKVQHAKADTLKQEDLKAQMEDFLKEAEVCLAEIETDLQELQSVSDTVAEYFCEDPSKFKLEECCSIFKSFCEKFMRAIQENKAREMAELKRRHRDRLQNAAKRRSTATCSSRDKEMDGIALESMLQNFLTNRVSRRRSGRPSSTYGSPTSGSPNNGSLSEIISQANLLTGQIKNQNRGGSLKAMEMGRKEWNSADELTENSSHKNTQSNSEDNKAKGGILHGEEMKTPGKEDTSGLTRPANRIPSISFTGRAFSVTTEDDEEDLQDNNEAEALKLREASKKVLRYQNSRSSVSSGDYSLENQKSPGARSGLPRQRTFDEATQRYPGDPTDEDLVRFLLNPQSPSKRNLGRRHTLPTKVPKTEEEEDNLWVKPTDRPCPFLSVAQSVDSVVEDWDTYNGKLSLRPAMLTLHSLLLGIHTDRQVAVPELSQLGVKGRN
eukprot:superscaffoldBa00000001_g15